MKLFTINPDIQEVDLNKEWMFLVPEFAALLKRDKGSPGDYRGDKKLKARREFTYIYFMEDFGSTIRDWEPKKKHAEALRCASLKDIDIDKEVLAAQSFYNNYLRECAPTLRTLDAVYEGREEFNRHLREVNFNKVDKLGKSLYNAKDYQNLIRELPKMNASIKEFERQVWEELKENSGIRGKRELGIKEAEQRPADWSEGAAPTTDRFSQNAEPVEV